MARPGVYFQLILREDREPAMNTTETEHLGWFHEISKWLNAERKNCESDRQVDVT
jgi:hypothetical protein